MKKTFPVIASIIALAGSAHAAIVFDYQANPQTASDLYQPDVTGALLISQTFTGVSSQKTGSNYVNSFLSPNANVGNGTPWSVTLSFTVTETVTVDSIALNLFTFNASNAIQNNDRRGAYTFDLKQNGDVLASCSNSNLTYAGTQDVTSDGSQQASVDTLGQRGGSSGVREEGTLDKAVVLSTGNTYTIEISLNRGSETQGYFVGLGALELNTVPEPATASLGLLGVAALMMRRRRL
ncbi:PEP-CTERM sorting domain-containing protein [Akkermansia sp.]|uniref:PEP-CTERM sorting domain-containing protein n=1 Tax=Akkermansia sp. TaxID=1872421 RepID=UPI0025BC60B6|nr:PEP-CTERM sorting domain-containing protein [Akkermansia sp.]